ncbi:dethiobiotin synthetase [Candidatus Methylobacter favarea]|uniref:ATP-dependent dethiobiotin synthetase BioD n=1 Tax=Candidatus Methylobacter favarea TaxID=2707345 RepID=A0A8S0XS21_9GAMM|nr:dethiobiotin synthase [Candidatus Methylobacter favarea]CAA9890432.1 dethiobiotin synthetase [Candidatus Methylobacter favarea]
MGKGFFITGTDTNAGKTWATVALMRYFKAQGKSVAGMKPVASGCSFQEGKLKNEDALLIQENASLRISYDLINFYAYELAASPHIAGTKNPVNLKKVVAAFNALKELTEIVLVEGAGGWYTPLNERERISDLAKLLGLPVIMVVAIRLGCINHAILTHEAIRYSGIKYAGWMAACTDPKLLNLKENIQTLQSSLDVPLVGVLPYMKVADFNFLGKQLQFPKPY